MRALAILALVAIVLMFLGGWLYFQDNGNTSEIIIDKAKVQQDTEQAVEAGKELTKKAADGLNDLGKDIQESVKNAEPESEEAPISQ